MGKFKHVDCPICKKPLENGETIVVCPDCGTPYHKGCVDTVGRCIQDELHATGKSFELPKMEHKYAADEEKRCSRCGTMNPAGGLFCVVCGNELHEQEQKRKTDAWQQPQPQQTPFQMPYDPYNTPFGGVNPDDEIDGIAVRDWAIFVGQNTSYFIPKFKEYGDKPKKTGFNLPSMLLGGIYFLYRKMYLWGIMLILVSLVISVPAVLLQLDTLRQMLGEDLLYTNETVIRLSNICSILNLAFMALCAIFTNRLYYWHCNSKIRKLQQTHDDDLQYRTKLTEKGSVSRLAIVIMLAIYFLSSFGLSLILVQTLIP